MGSGPLVTGTQCMFCYLFWKIQYLVFTGYKIVKCSTFITSFIINLILKKYVTLPTISFYNMNAMGIGQMILYLGINVAIQGNIEECTCLAEASLWSSSIAVMRAIS